jgi:serine/threonine-protein kinase
MSDFREALQTELGDAYNLGTELHGGGMARVFVAEDTRLRRKIVIKLLAPEQAAGISLERFERETALAASLQHPNIVPLFSAGHALGAPYYMMPFVDGQSLRARLTATGGSGRPLPIDETVNILRDVARALLYAQEHDVVHRDIKPDNILLTGDVAVVTDFGIARALSAARTDAAPTLTQAGVAIGTPAYMSPEQASADVTDFRSDFYSFGCVAYEMLTGAPPFVQPSSARTLAAHITQLPTPVSQARPDCPAPLARLVMSCLEKDPARRPQSARDLVAALATTTPTSISPARHAPRRLVVGVVVAAALIVVAGILQMMRTRTPSEHSIAVLAFDHPAADSTQEYFSDGIADDISTQLAEIPGLRVAARSSANVFKGKETPPAQIGQALHVSNILGGSVRRLGDNVTVHAELVNASDGSAMWSQSFERQTRDVISVQHEIVGAIVSALRLKFADGERARSTHAPDPTTYDLYLRGRYLTERGSQADLVEGISLLNQALRRDSLFAPTYSTLAYAYTGLADAYAPPAEMYPKARALAARARVLDPLSSEPLAMLGSIDAQYEYAWARARAELDSAIALNPFDPNAHSTLASFFAYVQNNPTAADREIRSAINADPLNPFLHFTRAFIAKDFGQFAQAMDSYRRAQELSPGFMYGEPIDADVFLGQHRLDSALVINERAEKVLGYPPPGLVATLAALGRRNDALVALGRMKAAAKARYYPPEQLARAYAALGDIDNAFVQLNRGVDVHSAWALLSPRFADLRVLKSDARWPAYLRRIGIER